jgi:alkanesulfonate monooxygenase SsuD/methylene tetrahydromethanopterin reductase-like flavin-dependent oxidoreductase (luciferase family)
VPILIGGHAEAALKRAAYLGDGWMFAGGAPEELSRCLDRLAVLRREAGRENEPFEIHAGSMDAFKLDGVKRLEDQGITDVIVGFRNAYDNAPDIQPLDVKIGALRVRGQDHLEAVSAFARSVLERLATWKTRAPWANASTKHNDSY